MNTKFIKLVSEGKKILVVIPAVVSYLFITLFVGKLLVIAFNIGNTVYIFTTFLPFIVKLLEGFSASDFSSAFMEWWGSLSVNLHWAICDIFIYYFFSIAYFPKFSTIWNRMAKTINF